VGSCRSLPGLKLPRVDEDRHHHHVGLAAGGVNQGQMAFMEEAHGRHQRDASAGVPVRGKGGTKPRDGGVLFKGGHSKECSPSG
jgi:hypothetical protein